MTRRILILEDDPETSAMLAAVLTDEGHTTVTAPTADAALSMLAGVRPHLILCDLLLPGMDGIAFYERLLRRGPAPPLIFLTALSPTLAEARLQVQAPDRPVLYKPIDLDELVLLVDAYLDRTN